MRSVVDIRPFLPPESTKDRLIAMLQSEADAAIAFMERGVRVRIDRGSVVAQTSSAACRSLAKPI